MIALPSGLIFAADAGLVFWTAWIGVCAAGLNRRGLLELSLGWLLLGVAWIAGSGILLGLVGELGRLGFLGLHAAGLVGLLLWRRSQWREDIRQWREWGVTWRRLLGSGKTEGWLVAGLILVMLGLALLAAQAEPIVYDALTYRLSRIAAWLQDGWIRPLSTDDPRLNYMPVAPDVVIAWLLGATNAGFHLAPLSQLAGGLLLLGATFGLARIAGLTRMSALGAVALVLGMANVAVQFTTVQSDLFTAGVFAAAYLLWHRALDRGEGSWVAGVGVALAFGSKGTMFYLAPGAALWVGWLVWRHRDHWRALIPTAMGLVVAGLLFATPGWWRNHTAYGSWAGPREAVVLHHGESASPAHYPEKMMRNLGTSAVQLFEPTAQPFWLQGPSLALGVVLTARQPAQPDDYVFIGQSRRAQLERVMQMTEPDADVVTCGVLAALLFLAGLLAAGFGYARLPGAPQVLVWGAGAVIYLGTQHALVQWHHWGFRFMVLAAPWMAVGGAWAVTRLPRLWRIAVWAGLLVSAGDVFLSVQTRANQAAWQAVTRPSRAAAYYQFSHWRAWAARLDRPQEPLRLAFPIDRELAAFYRLDPPRRSTIESLSGLRADTAEAAVGAAPGWLVVPLEHFMGREGRVLGRIGPFEIAAYRALQPGEEPQPLLYRLQARKLAEKNRDELLLRTWAGVPVRLELTNPATAPCTVVLKSPTGTVNTTVPARGSLIVDMPMPPDVLCWVTVDYAPPGLTAGVEGGLFVRLLP